MYDCNLNNIVENCNKIWKEKYLVSLNPNCFSILQHNHICLNCRPFLHMGTFEAIVVTWYTPETQILIQQWAICEFSRNFEKSALNTPKWPWDVQGQKLCLTCIAQIANVVDTWRWQVRIGQMNKFKCMTLHTNQRPKYCSFCSTMT